MLSYALVSRQGKVIKKKLIHRTKRKKIHITADTAHLLNRMGVCVPVHAFRSSILSVCVCVCVSVSVYCLGAGMDNAILLHLWTSGTWIRTQAQCRRLTAQWQHGPAHCTFLQTAGAVGHLTERRIKINCELRGQPKCKCNACIFRSIFKLAYMATHPRAREISSSCVLCSGCPFSAGFILYCWTSCTTWFSWVAKVENIDFNNVIKSLEKERLIEYQFC